MIKKTILVDVARISSRTFSVKKGEHLTLAIIARSPKQKEAHFIVRLVGKGAKATIIGLVIGTGDTQFSLHTLQLHEAPETTSDLLVKSILTDQAKFSYDGEIRVEKRAQKTNAYQRNENLLLSDNASARSDPSLEILANDVRCTHGATVGKISEDELWYLASRGISSRSGRKLITRGFLESAIMRISDTIGAEKVRRSLWKTL